MDIRLALMTGIDIPMPECKLIIHQPTIKDISYIGEQNFFVGAQCLCLNKSMYEDQIKDVTSFQIFMMIIQDERAKDKKENIYQVLTILFPKYKILFTPRSILFNLEGENFIIDEDNFEIFQSYLKQIFCLGQSGQDSFNPGNAAAKAIADKLMKARQRVAAEKNASQGSVFGQHISVLSIAIGFNIQNLIELTVFQLYDLVERYGLYVNWDLDIRSRLAGGKPDSKPDNWMKNIH